ncbi:hypothetical protein BCY86_04025 [Pajaroellobacter abortibovis]|uniref:Uncharacterized protein n=1 Tax=Pajaroellobacter abortibovis TaxID=1882918 RepID=A0A1L6MWK8_9BACT|nr:hypothetical protein BCY86_04025 [Pajaroellobacter abortibovis]
MSFIWVQGRWEREGEPPLLCIHGFMGHPCMWNDFLKFLSYPGSYRVFPVARAQFEAMVS